MKTFYNLIPSETTRKYCIKTNYKLSPLDCIILVHDCNKISLEKKHLLYNEIMKTMPEPELPQHMRDEIKSKLSLYKMLKQYMQREKKQARLFLEDAEDAFYSVISLKLCPLKDAMDDWRKSFLFKSDGTACIDNQKKGLRAQFLPNGEMESIFVPTVYNTIFDFSAKLPHQFKRGDILLYKEFDYYHLCVFDSFNEGEEFATVYKFDTVGGFLEASKKKLALSILEYDTKKPKDHCWHYSKFNKKAFKLLSDYFNGTISLETFLNAYSYAVKDVENEFVRDHIYDEYVEEFIKQSESEE